MKRFPSVLEAKEQILEVGRRMYQRAYVAANDGNISCRVAEDVILMTPTGVSKGFMTEDMIIKMTLEGEVLSDDSGYKPSSEGKMHIRAYRENPEIMAVTHAHPPVATSFAIAGIGLDKAILPEAVVNLGTVPIAKYANPGSQDVPDSIAPFCRDYNAVLLANHGALTWGTTLFEAFYRLESLEYYATVTMYTNNIIGQANVLSCNQVDMLLQTREKLGITAGGVPPCAVMASNERDILPGGAQAEKPSGCNCGDPSKTVYGGAANTIAAPDAQVESLIEQAVREVLAKL